MSSITTRTLSCGLRLVVETSTAVRSAAMCWLLPAGAATDPGEREGCSTLMSELMFRGAGSRRSREQADEMDRLGLSRGADVGGQFIRFAATMLGDRALEALPVLVDAARSPRLDPEAIEPTRDLALQALAGLRDQPQERAGVLLSKRHNPPPFDRSGLGSEAGLRGATREELAGYWSARVRPGGSILALAGRLDVDAAADRLESLLEGWTGAAPEPAWSDSPTRGTHHHEPDPSSQVHIFLAHEAPRESSPDALLERIAISVLSGGSSSRLFTEVREKRGLCYSVSASYAADKHWGRVTGYVGTTPDKAQQSLDVMLGELQRIGTPAGAVTPEEFSRAVVGYKSRLVFSGESTGARAGALANDMHRLGRPRSLVEMAAAVDEVTLEQVNAYVARRNLGAITTVALGPGKLTRA